MASVNLFGIYAGIVEKNDDPEKLGRVKVRVPHFYGATGSSTGYIGVNDLPWALPAGMPAGSSSASGGLSLIPGVGDKVWVQFLDGEVEKPVYQWGMQTLPDAKHLKLHKYTDLGGGKVGSPDATRWTRNGHAIEINPDGITETTSRGYRLLLTDGGDVDDGSVTLSSVFGFFSITDDGETSSGNITLTNDLDLVIGDEVRASARSYDLTATTGGLSLTIGGEYKATVTGSIDFTTGDKLSLHSSLDSTFESDLGMTLTAQTNINLAFAQLKMNTGSEPFVRGTQLVNFLQSLLLYLATHVHETTSQGAPTSPPLVPPQSEVQPNPAQLVSTTIFGE